MPSPKEKTPSRSVPRPQSIIRPGDVSWTRVEDGWIVARRQPGDGGTAVVLSFVPDPE